MRIVLIQSMLVGLNIGCYVTPIGALAGLLFFNIIGREERRRKGSFADKAVQAGENPPLLDTVAMPDRCDLVRFGFINFMVVAIVLGLLLPFFAALIDLLINSPGDSAHSPLVGMISIYHYLLYIGFLLATFVVLKFRDILQKGNVLLAHMREVFSVMTRATVWTMTNRGIYMTLLAVGFLAFASLLLYWAEDTNILIYGHPGDKPLFDSISSFVLWLLVFSSAGLGGTSNLQQRAGAGDDQFAHHADHRQRRHHRANDQRQDSAECLPQAGARRDTRLQNCNCQLQPQVRDFRRGSAAYA